MMTNQQPNAGNQLLIVLRHCKTDEDRLRHIDIIYNKGAGIETMTLAVNAAEEAINTVRLNARSQMDKLRKERIGHDQGFVSHKIESLGHDANRIIEIYAGIIKLLNEKISIHQSMNTTNIGMKRL